MRVLPLSLVTCCALALAGAILPAQATQTLPRGFDSGAGGSGSAFPFNAAPDHIWQWHYHSGQFNALGQIIITQAYIRPLGAVTVNAFSFNSVELVMASSPTDYTVAGNGVQAGHNLNFAANLNPDATIVRTGSPWTGPSQPAGWLSLGLTAPFSYNPTLGQDFVFQIRKCAGSPLLWGQSIFGSSGAAGVVGGNRYGDQASCSAAGFTFSNNEYVPIIRIDYIEQNNLSITQGGPGVGNLNLSMTMLSPSGFEGFTLLSANTSQPLASGPIIGLWPDSVTWSVLGYPYFPGNPFHFRSNDPGLFPSAPFIAPPGSVTALSGLTFDIVAFLLNQGGGFDSRSNLVRYTFQ